MIFKFIYQFLKKNPQYAVLNIVFMSLEAIDDILLPDLYGKLFDSVSSGKISGNTDFLTNFIKILLAIVFFRVLDVIDDYQMSYQHYDMKTEIQDTIIKNIFARHNKEQEEIFSGELMPKVIKIQKLIGDYYHRLKSHLVPHFIFFILSLFYFAYYDVYLGIGMLFFLCSVIINIFGGLYGCQKETSDTNEAVNQIYLEIEDLITNINNISAEKKEKKEIERLEKFNDKHRDAHFRTVKCSTKYKVMGTVFLICFLIFFVYRLYILTTKKAIKPGKLVTFFFLLKYNISLTNHLTALISNFVYDYGMMNDLTYLLNDKVKSPSPQSKDQCKFPSTGIGLSNVIFKYPKNQKPTINKATLHIDENECLLLVGSNGSGKTTILNLLANFIKPNHGCLYIKGKDYRQYSKKELNQLIGYMPQTPVLFNRSIIENIQYAQPNISREEVIRILKKFKLLQAFSNLENGIDTKVGKGGSKLSGGQKQILWFIRIYFKNPEVLLLDEPTSALDKKKKEIVSELVKEVFKNKTVIMISHDPFLLSFTKRTVKLHQGEIMEEFKPEL